MLGKIGNDCEMYATSHKRPFVPSVGVSNYYVMYSRGPSQFSGTSANVTNWMTIPLDGSVNFCE